MVAAATLAAAPVPRRAPVLPGAAGLDAATRKWWRTVWRSPMAGVWLEADVPALVRLASLVDLVHRGEASATILAEIRQLEDRFGLSPLARRRLQWEVSRAAGKDTAESSDGGDDERWLRVVSG